MCEVNYLVFLCFGILLDSMDFCDEMDKFFFAKKYFENFWTFEFLNFQKLVYKPVYYGLFGVHLCWCMNCCFQKLKKFYKFIFPKTQKKFKYLKKKSRPYLKSKNKSDCITKRRRKIGTTLQPISQTILFLIPHSSFVESKYNTKP